MMGIDYLSYLGGGGGERPRRRHGPVVPLLALSAAVLFFLLLLPGCGLVDGTGDELAAPSATETTFTDEAPAGGAADQGDGGVVGPVGTLRVAAGAPNSLNPHDDQTPATFSAYAWVFEGLVRQSPDGSFVPWLAESWSAQSGGTTVVFDLHDGVEFSNGEPFDAAAVKANIDYVKSGPPDQVIPPVAGQMGNVESVEVLGDYQVAFHLFSPGEVPLIAWLARNSGFMVAPSSLGRAATDPVGTGPYVFNAEESAVDLTHMVFDASTSYWRPGLVGVERVEIDAVIDPQARRLAFEAGQYDVAVASLDLGPPSVGGQSIAPSVIFSFTVVDWEGERVPQLADRDVRCAMAQALNREGLVAQAGASPEAVRYQWAATQGAYAYIDDLDVPSFDIDAATDAFAASGEAGFELGNGFMPGTPFETGSVSWAGALRELGITMDNEALDPPTGGEMFARFTAGQYPVQIIPWNEPHPLTMLQQRATTGGVLNPSGTVPDGVDELVASASGKNNEEAAADIEAAMRIMLEQCIWIPYYALEDGYWVQDHVTGVEKVTGVPVFFWPHGVRVDG